jgi:uncharacterized membrane protein YfcA
MPLAASLAPHVVVFLAAAAATVTGYGFVVLSAPVLVLLLPSPLVVPLTLGLGWVLVTAVLIRPDVRRAIDPRRLARLALPGIVGVPFGAALLDVLSQHTLRITLGLAVAASAVLPLLVGRVAEPPQPSAGAAEQRADRRRSGGIAVYAAGLAAGVLSGCVGLNGPPVALYLAWRGTAKDETRATSAAAVWLLSSVTLVFFAASARLPDGMAMRAAALGPALLIGWGVGSALFHRIPVPRFRQVSIGFAAAAGLVTALAGLRP